MPFRLVALAIMLAAGCAPAPKRPNVVVITVDTLRADRLPFYGHARDTAPFLSKLADESVVFERAWSTSSWTAPSTASLFTGVYPNQHGVRTGLWVHERFKLGEHGVPLNRIPGGLQTMPELLKSLGYRTFGVTDNRNICEGAGFHRGFDRFENFHYQGAAEVNRVLDGWVDEIRNGPTPWFVYLHFMDPHEPYNSHAPWFEPAVGEYAEPNARYESEINYVDAQIEQALSAIGVDDQTVVVFVSDHGEEFGDHGGTSHRFQLYSELTRVPMFVRHPGVTPHRLRVDENVSLIDVLPTLRSILGAPPSRQDKGVDLRRYYLGEAPPPRHVFAMRTWTRPTQQKFKRAVVFGDEKYIETEPTGEVELYDLAQDPREQENLAPARPERVARMRAKWAEFEANCATWRQESVDLKMSADEIETLKELGYTGNK